MADQKRTRNLTWRDLADEVQLIGPTTDGWTTVRPAGWEAFTVEVQIGAYDGAARVIGLRLAPKRTKSPEDFDACVLTTARLRTFPLQALADAIYASNDQKARKGRGKANERSETRTDRKTDVRQVTTIAAVVEAYLADTSGAPRKHVAETLTIGERTAGRYIGQARDLGLLPRERPRRRNSQTSGTSRNSKKKG